MSKEYYRNRIADKRKEIVGLRADLADKKAAKTKRLQIIASQIRTSTPSNKEYHRKEKISESARYTKEIERLKEKIEHAKKELDSLKKQLASAK